MDESSIGKELTKAGLDAAGEFAKADQEQQKTAREALELVKQAGEFLGRIFNPAATEFGLILGDQMRYWRFKNFVNVLSKAQKLADERGLSRDQIKSLPFGDAIRAIEAASMEEEDNVQELWARLIANAADPTKHVNIKKLYVDILKSLSSPEVVFLDLLWACEARGNFIKLHEIAAFTKEMNEIADGIWRKFDDIERRQAIQNLVRIRCVTFRPRPIDLRSLFATLPREQYQSMFHSWAAIDPKEFQRVINELGEMIFVAAGTKDFGNTGPIPLHLGGFGGSVGKIEVPEMNFMLTPLGNDLMRACRKL